MSRHGRWSFGNEDEWDVYAQDDAAAEVERHEDEARQQAEELQQLNQLPERDEDCFASDAEYWCRVFRHLPLVPNPDHRKAVEGWVLKDIYTSPTLSHGGCLAAETLRGTSMWLYASGVIVRDAANEPIRRTNGLPDGALYPQQVVDYVVQGVGFCLATEVWLTSTAAHELGWEMLLSRCKAWFRSEIRSKKPFSKRSPR